MCVPCVPSIYPIEVCAFKHTRTHAHTHTHTHTHTHPNTHTHYIHTHAHHDSVLGTNAHHDSVLGTSATHLCAYTVISCLKRAVLTSLSNQSGGVLGTYHMLMSAVGCLTDFCKHPGRWARGWINPCLEWGRLSARCSGLVGW